MFIIMFYIVSFYRSHVLQATSEEECTGWVKALQSAVVAAYTNNTLPREVQTSSEHDRAVRRTESAPMLDHNEKKQSRYNINELLY